MVFSPFVGYVDVVLERVAANICVGVDTLDADTTFVISKSIVDMVFDVDRVQVL